MPKPFRPKIVRWLLDGKRVSAGTEGAVKRVDESPWWWAHWTDRFGVLHREKLGRTTEAEAQRILTQLMAAADREAAGMTDQFSRHAATPILDHVAAWCADVLASGATARHVAAQRNQTEAVFDAAEILTLRHLDGERVRRAIDRMRRERDARPPLDPTIQVYTTAELAHVLRMHPASLRKAARRCGIDDGARGGTGHVYTAKQAVAIAAGLRGFGLNTMNHYLGACKAFSAWCAGPIGRRLAADPLAALQAWNADTDRRLIRRALTEAQFEAFVEAAAAGPTFRGITGPQRLVLYTFAANTGLRAAELASLTPQSFSWSHESATVTVEARVSKRRREDIIPLRADVAEMMRQYVVPLDSKEPLWPGRWHLEAATMVRIDLQAAGVPFEEGGRVVDFHALRSMLASYLAAGGIHPRIAQELMRHSDLRLTLGIYTDLGVLDVRGALDALPPLPGRRGETEAGQGAAG